MMHKTVFATPLVGFHAASGFRRSKFAAVKRSSLAMGREGSQIFYAWIAPIAAGHSDELPVAGRRGRLLIRVGQLH